VTRRQTIPEQWLIVDAGLGDELWQTMRNLRRGSGVLIVRELRQKEQRGLRQFAKIRGLTVVVESPRAAARVHNMRELRQALLRRTPLILISPLYETRSHPDWRPLPPMRAATLARLAGRRAIALGGMNRQRYAKVAPLGFISWAGISAFRT
jgi:thiamine-phosphate pyrophosphorylase